MSKNLPEASARLWGTTQSIKILGTKAQLRNSAISPISTKGQIAMGASSTTTKVKYTIGADTTTPSAATRGSEFEARLRNLPAANAPNKTPAKPEKHVTAPKPREM